MTSSASRSAMVTRSPGFFSMTSPLEQRAESWRDDLGGDLAQEVENGVCRQSRHGLTVPHAGRCRQTARGRRRAHAVAGDPSLAIWHGIAAASGRHFWHLQSPHGEVAAGVPADEGMDPSSGRQGVCLPRLRRRPPAQGATSSGSAPWPSHPRGRDVWICPWPNGHIQAIGTDAAGRRQYLYHPDWRAKRDEMKFDRVKVAGTRLAKARERIIGDLRAEGMPLARAAATATRLLDLGYFRIGSDAYADANGSFGLTTLERRHVRRQGRDLVFSFVGKSGIEHSITISDPHVIESLNLMRKRRGGSARLLAYRGEARWADLDATAVNAYISRDGRRGPHGQGLPHVARDRPRRGRTGGEPREGGHQGSRKRAVKAPPRRSPPTSATPRRSRRSRTSTRGSSTSTRPASRSPAPSRGGTGTTPGARPPSRRPSPGSSTERLTEALGLDTGRFTIAGQRWGAEPNFFASGGKVAAAGGASRRR